MDSRAESATNRAILAVLMAFAMALRLLSPAGFMPAFDRGAVTIVVCPDAEPGAMTMAHHHHGGHSAHPQPCPYAAAASVGPLPWDLPAIVPSPVEPSALPAVARVEASAANHLRDRPPATGPPPLPA
jgi:hypothetical protein